MAHKKNKKHQVHVPSKVKLQEQPVLEESFVKTEKLQESNKESWISIILGALIVIIIGVIVYNYFSGLNKNNLKISKNNITESVSPTAVPSKTATVMPTEKPIPTATIVPTKIPTIAPTAIPTKLITKEEIGETTKPKVIKGKITSYKVALGDSLWTIAQKFYNDGYKWTEISKINKLENPDEIEIGMILSVPVPTVKQGEILPEAASTVGPKAITGTVYKVDEGDDLWDIAVRACGDGYKWPLLATSNKIENPDLIHPGNILKIKCK